MNSTTLIGLFIAAHAFGDGPLQNHWMQRKALKEATDLHNASLSARPATTETEKDL